jgi:hypothetical protein
LLLIVCVSFHVLIAKTRSPLRQDRRRGALDARSAGLIELPLAA